MKGELTVIETKLEEYQRTLGPIGSYEMVGEERVLDILAELAHEEVETEPVVEDIKPVARSSEKVHEEVALAEIQDVVEESTDPIEQPTQQQEQQSSVVEQ